MKTELDNFKAELEVKTKKERLNFDSRIKDLSAKMEEQLASDREKISQQYEVPLSRN